MARGGALGGSDGAAEWGGGRVKGDAVDGGVFVVGMGGDVPGKGADGERQSVAGGESVKTLAVCETEPERDAGPVRHVVAERDGLRV